MPCLVDITQLSNELKEFSYLENTVNLNGKDEKLFSGGVVTKNNIDEVIKKIAEEIYQTYSGKKILLVDVLEGGDLLYQGVIKELNRLNEIDNKIDFTGSSVKIESYHGLNSNGKPKVKKHLKYENRKYVTDLSQYDAIVTLDDIKDTSTTMRFFLENYLESNRFKTKAKSKAVSFLFEKDLGETNENGRAIEKYNTISNGFYIKNWFIVGAKLDLKIAKKFFWQKDLHLFRQLPDVYVFDNRKGLLDKMTIEYHKGFNNSFINQVRKYITPN